MQRMTQFFVNKPSLLVCCLVVVLALCLPACSQDKDNSTAEAPQQQSTTPPPDSPQKDESSIARLLNADSSSSISDIRKDALGALREVASIANDPSLKELETELHGTLSQIIGTGGSILSSVAGGVQEGAGKVQEKMEGAIDTPGDGNGVTVISSKENLNKYLTVDVHKVEDLGNGTWRLTVALRNSNEFTARLVGLDRKQTVLLLDTEDFAYFPTSEQAKSVTVVPRAAAKVDFTFTGLDAKPKTFRLFETDFPVNTPR